MSSDENPDFAKLRYLFWKHLGWKKRLRVLKDLQLIPNSANKPLPQTMERMFLEVVAANNKLAELWDAVMQHVPKRDKQENPFR